jgi:hypothetical protein
MKDELKVLLDIDVPVFQGDNGDYTCFTSNLDVCNDGSGPAHGDPHHQAQTAYYNGGKYLNADKDFYIVTPPQVIKMVPGVVLGCLGRVTNLHTGISHDGVVGDIGPEDKTGECAYCLAKKLNPKVKHNSGDMTKIYLYEFWPGLPAVVGNKEYALQPS